MEGLVIAWYAWCRTAPRGSNGAEAALRAVRQSKEAVDRRDFDEAIDRVVAGLERKSRA